MPEIVPAKRHTPEDEALALTVHCEVCNAPANIPCQYIYWVKTADVTNCGRVTIPGSWKATLKPKQHHSRRLKDAIFVKKQKEKHG